MNENEIETAIKFYRSLAKKEMENEKIVNGTLVGPRSEVKTEKLGITDVINPSRPFMAKNVGNDLDSAYVSTFRIGHYNLPAQLASTGQGTTFIGGMEFGSNLVQQEIIKSLDELVSFLAEYKVGIVDIFDEQSINGTKILDLRIYECIECAELPNMGKALCFFEAGLITGVLSEITKKEVKTEEVRCWTSGYSFCQFEVKING